mmetsp:Transcript_28523/g.67840  ORF Transcript_28523/g.67840 Transcript_28523/m.67840 type:complete len:211 (-) Transcript_28523:13-645(-)
MQGGDDQAGDQVQRLDLRADQGGGRPAQALLHQLQPAVLLPHRQRHGQRHPRRGQADGHARRQRGGQLRAARADGHPRGHALRLPRGRQDRRCRGRVQARLSARLTEPRAVWPGDSAAAERRRVTSAAHLVAREASLARRQLGFLAAEGPRVSMPLTTSRHATCFKPRPVGRHRVRTQVLRITVHVYLSFVCARCGEVRWVSRLFFTASN